MDEERSASLSDPYGGLDRLAVIGLDAYLPGPGVAADPDEDGGPTRYGFRVGNVGLLIPSEKVCEVVEQLPICVLPNSEDWLLGMVNLRGTLVPIFDLHRLLGEDKSQAVASRFFVIDKGVDAVGMVIDGLPQPVETQNRVENVPPLPQALQDTCSCAYIDHDSLWLDFDAERFFLSVSGRDQQPGGKQ